MDFTPVIEDLQNRIAALNSVIEAIKRLHLADYALKFDSEIDSMPSSIEAFALAEKKPTGKAKAAPKPKKVKSSMGGNKSEAILSYLRQYPGSGSKEIAKALGFSRAATTWNLANAKKSNLVRMDGKTTNVKYSLVKQDASAKTPPPSDPDDLESSLECKFCHAPCASPERLERHMRLVHNR